jgi:diketogulonate reductase-like aldo/keto reductase
MPADRTNTSVPRIGLWEGVEIPQLGFGVFQIPPKETEAVVEQALEVGYRHVDTAAAYRNEAACARAVRASDLGREAVFLTTKCWNEDQGFEEAKAALAGSLDRLGFEYVDLYLIHWPVPSRDLYVDTWRAFVQLRAEGFVRAIGVSNFQPEHLRRIIEATGQTPEINQVELHPYLQQAELRAEHARLGIVTEAWSPLAQGLVLEDPVIAAIAAEHDRTPGQVVIRWQLQLGNVVIPKSVTPRRIRENFDVFDFELSDEDMARIEGLDRGERIGPDPDVFVAP